jgi:D-glycero-D-manno-heptose 1,7-bisphosphate phosphatase
MVDRASRSLGFDPAKSFVVGDHAGDMRLGRSIGATTILVLTGHGPQECREAEPFADHTTTDLLAATQVIGSIIDAQGR